MRVGNSNIKDILIGENPIVKIYKGLEVVWKRKELPDGYRQVAYLESAGTQWIDTGYLVKSNTIIEFDFQSTKEYGDTYEVFFGTQVDASLGGRCYIVAGAQQNLQINYPRNAYTYASPNSNGTYGRNSADTYPYAFWSSLRSLYTMNISRRTIQVDDRTWNFSSYMTEDFVTPTNSLYLLTRNNNGVPYNYCAKGKLYGFKIKEDEELIMDLIPCLDDEYVPCMYDTVSKETFYNSGTGIFEWGDETDIPENYTRLSYLESTGTQYIDTGINADNKLGFETRMSYNSGRFGAHNIINSITHRHHFYDNGYWGFGVTSTYYGGLHQIDTPYKVSCNFYNDYKYIDNDGMTNELPNTAFDTEVNFYLFRRNGLYPMNFTGKIYYFKMTYENILVRDFIPCLDENNKPCLYDRVTQRTFYNAGTGEFLYGEIN